MDVMVVALYMDKYVDCVWPLREARRFFAADLAANSAVMGQDNKTYFLYRLLCTNMVRGTHLLFWVCGRVETAA